MDKQDILSLELARIAKPADGQVGLAALHLESARTAQFNAANRFPMASTYKIAIAACLLDRVDAGQHTLDDMIKVEAADYAPGSGPITALVFQPGLAMSIRNIVHLMLTVSDNTCSDIALRLCGGPSAVNDFLQGKGIDQMRIDRPTKYILADNMGFSELASSEAWSLSAFRERYRSKGPAPRAPFVDNDLRDSTSPLAMCQLIEQILEHKLLSRESCGFLMGTMAQCKTGDGRIAGMLPAGTAVAHKTGSLYSGVYGTITNDAGVITLPEDWGHIIMAVYIKASSKSISDCERVLAQLARCVYDYFLFTMN